MLRQAGGDVRLESVALPASEPRRFDLAPPSDWVTVVVPLGVGKSADLVQRSAGARAAIARCDGSRLAITIERPDGRRQELPPVDDDAFERFDLRVHVVGGSGLRRGFRVTRGLVAPAAGPVLDLFGGRIPLAPGDYSVTLESAPASPAGRVTGSAPLVAAGGHLYLEADGGAGRPLRFVVDTAASGSVVARAALPAGVEVAPVESVEYGPDGARRGATTAQGLGGAAAVGYGRAALPALRVGSIRFDEVEIGVVDRLPELDGAPLDGILGLDLLRRAAVARLERGGDGGMLRLLEAATQGAGAELPFEIAGGHLYLPAKVDDVPVHLLLDSGARLSMLPRALAAKLPRLSAAGAAESVHGLDGRPIDARPMVASRLDLGGLELTAPTFAVLEDASLFESSGLGAQAAILGDDLLRRFPALELDFAAGRARFWSPLP
jgi:predicted aspartyl protease